jgi:RsiW-degrading membrane proteinase PrsW (M82 family)
MIFRINYRTPDMVHPNASSHDRKEHRWLRVTIILAFLPAFALLLPYGIISARPLPTAGIVAMFFSATFSTLVLGGGVRSPWYRSLL